MYQVMLFTATWDKNYKVTRTHEVVVDNLETHQQAKLACYNCEISSVFDKHVYKKNVDKEYKVVWKDGDEY
jgi:hypothetical protein